MMKNVKPIFVIICGGSGSGKTTVANLIQESIPKTASCEVISLDWFYLSKDRIKTTNYDSPEAIDWFEVREAIKFLIEEKTETKIPIYDFISQTVTEKKTIKPADVIILEGILSLTNEDVNRYADIKLYIDVPDDERLIRRLLRDIKTRNTDIEKTIKMWRETVIDMHHEYVEPKKYISDIVIPWGNGKQNMVPIKAVAGALEYMIYSTKNRKRNEIIDVKTNAVAKKKKQYVPSEKL
ncbi:MAG: AAA family ATPase [Mycoplasmataceae bacterium]|nr:AAA family ATPase [Mycoplasmataceae bacterium]